MKESDKIYPPKWAERFLNWYCKPELLEDLQGDLNEYFERNLKVKGRQHARFIYVIDVFKFLRLYTLRKPEFLNLLIQWIMIGSYMKTSGRNIVRNKLFSAINIVGLAISMSVGLLLIGVLVDMYSYDKFHDNHDRIYRVISHYQYLDNKDDDFNATTSLRVAKTIKEKFTGYEEIAILRRAFDGDVTYGEKTVPLSIHWANDAVFKVFTFPFLQGDPATALKEPFSIVLTETSARKIFGDSEAIGKTLVFDNNKGYTVTGIMKDVPLFSHMHFDLLASLSTREITEKDNKNEMAWDNIWNAWVYVLMPDTNLESFQESLNQLSKEEDQTVKNTHIELALQPLDDIMLGDNLSNQIGNTLGRTLILVFIGLTIVVILSACFNYTNLSVARSLRRSREVGIRKVMGALKNNVIVQFVVEAVIISLLSLVAAFGIFILLRPHFLNMEPDLQELLRLELSPVVITYFFAFAIFIGVVAGFFPALFFARINAIQVLKNASTTGVFRKLTMRKVLIVFQYSVSLMLITGTLIIHKQYKHFLSYDLGFNTDNILNIRLQGTKPELLKKVLAELPEVKAISQSAMITSVGGYWGTAVKNPKNPEDSAYVYFNQVDEHYIPLHAHSLLAGQNFTARQEEVEESEVIVNQQVLKRFNLADQIPANAIGEILKVDGKQLKIIGVMKDFQYGRANNNANKEVVFRYSNADAEYLNLKIASNNLPDTYAKIEALYKKLDPVHPFAAKFYDDEIKDAFSGLEATMKLAGAIAFLAICIASLGLLGMVVFTTETRVKEISIRKVLGASEGKLLFLLGRGFFTLLGIAAAIALPVTYLFFESVMLPMIANHAQIGINEMIIGIMLVMILAVLMIGSQTLKVARTNPVDVLKAE